MDNIAKISSEKMAWILTKLGMKHSYISVSSWQKQFCSLQCASALHEKFKWLLLMNGCMDFDQTLNGASLNVSKR